jgi:hypothetical protein
MKCNFVLNVYYYQNRMYSQYFFFFKNLSEDDFKTDVDLRVACLILDKQVKLINGNEANILIPSNWMTLYIDDKGNITEPQPEIKQATEVPSMYIFITL